MTVTRELVTNLAMRLALVVVGLLLAALSAGCAAGDAPRDDSALQEAAAVPEAEGPGLEIYGQDRCTGAVAEERPPDARARSASDGVIAAVAYHEITDQVSVAVDPQDESELDCLIFAHMIRSLRDAGHEIAARPLFELSFSSHFHSPVYFEKEPDLGEVSFGRNLMPTRLEVNVWSSTHDSLLTGRRRRSGHTGQYDFEIHASLRERSSGRTVWDGRATAPVERFKAARAVPSMVDALVANLGRNALGDSFRLK